MPEPGQSQAVVLQQWVQTEKFVYSEQKLKFLRTAEAMLERAGLKAMINGVLSELLFCGRGLRVSLRAMGRTRLISF